MQGWVLPGLTVLPAICTPVLSSTTSAYVFGSYGLGTATLLLSDAGQNRALLTGKLSNEAWLPSRRSASLKQIVAINGHG